MNKEVPPTTTTRPRRNMSVPDEHATGVEPIWTDKYTRNVTPRPEHKTDEAATPVPTEKATKT